MKYKSNHNITDATHTHMHVKCVEHVYALINVCALRSLCAKRLRVCISRNIIKFRPRSLAAHNVKPNKFHFRYAQLCMGGGIDRPRSVLYLTQTIIMSGTSFYLPNKQTENQFTAVSGMVAELQKETSAPEATTSGPRSTCRCTKADASHHIKCELLRTDRCTK